MEIRFISSLTADDEKRVASAVLAAVGSLLDELPIAYTLKIETASGEVLHHTHPPVEMRQASRRDNDTVSQQNAGNGT